MTEAERPAGKAFHTASYRPSHGCEKREATFFWQKNLPSLFLKDMSAMRKHTKRIKKHSIAMEG
jgi:hypothetical protein